MMTALTESTVESAASAWLERMGGRAAHGPDIAPDLPAAERQRPLTRHVWLLQHAAPEGPGAIAAALDARGATSCASSPPRSNAARPCPHLSRRPPWTAAP